MGGVEIALTVAAVVVTVGGLGVLVYFFTRLRRAAAEAGVQARAAAEAVSELQRKLREQQAAGSAGPGPDEPSTAPPAYRDQRGWPNL